MRFIHLKAQVAVQEVVGKARELVDRFVALCRRAGGSASVKEYELAYNVICMFPRKAYVYVLPRKNGGLYMEVENLQAPEWKWETWVEDFKKGDVPNIRDVLAKSEKGGKITFAHVKITDVPTKVSTDEGFISGYFKKLEFSVAKDFERLSIYLE